MVFKLTVANYDRRYAKTCAWAGANNITFEEGYTVGGSKAIFLMLTKKELERLFSYLDIEDAPKVELP